MEEFTENLSEFGTTVKPGNEDRPPLGSKMCDLRCKVVFISRSFNMRYEGIVLAKCVFVASSLSFQGSLFQVLLY